MALQIGGGITLGGGIILIPDFGITVPGAPTIGTATATGPLSATVTFTAPVNNGGATITSYTATSNPGGITGTVNQAGSGTINVTGLTGSTSYTFTVTATNSAGTSSSSAASNSITTPAPPTVATAGWFSGGTAQPAGISLSRVQRITFATDTATASIRGPLTTVRIYTAGTGNFYYGWIVAGFTPSASTSVDRIDYSNDTTTASLRGPIPQTMARHGATGNSTDGWFGGGNNSITTITRITYATDTATAVNKGPLNIAANYAVGVGTDIQGWFAGGGSVPSPATPMSLVQRITYATDTAIASLRGPLSLARITPGGVTDTSTYGWIGGGSPLPSSSSFSTVDRITYANDTVTASVRGPLSGERANYGNGANDVTYGWFGGGYTSIVDRITYATDTDIATPRGPLNGVLSRNAGTSGAQ